jgi:hypothetical protein
MCFFNGFDISISIIKNLKILFLKNIMHHIIKRNIKIELNKYVCNVREINNSCTIDYDQCLVRKS